MSDLKESHLFRSFKEQQEHWYYKSKINVIGAYLKQYLKCRPDLNQLNCLDIGAGNGIISMGLGSSLSGRNLKWNLVDSGYSEADLSNSPEPYRRYRSAPFGKTYDIIVAIDVVEHVADDHAFCKSIEELLSPEGLLILCVPAFQFLWSPHDVFLGHYKRYNLCQLSSLLSDSSTIIASRYLYQMLFPVIAMFRLLARSRRGNVVSGSDLKIYPSPLNSLLFSVSMMGERLLGNNYLGSVVPGLSCLVVARKN